MQDVLALFGLMQGVQSECRHFRLHSGVLDAAATHVLPVTGERRCWADCDATALLHCQDAAAWMLLQIVHAAGPLTCALPLVPP